MLIQFSVKNFRSIRDEVSLSLEASSDKNLLENTFIEENFNERKRLLRAVAIYGANASGKSNILKAFAFLSNFVLQSSQNRKSNGTNIDQFKFDFKFLDAPSCFEIQFLYNSIHYHYCIEMNPEKILKEELYRWVKSTKRKKKETVFKRTEQKIVVNPSYLKEDEFTDKAFVKAFSRFVLPDSLFLSYAEQINISEIKEPYNWFVYNLRILFEHNPISTLYTSKRFLEHEPFKMRLVQYLCLADLAINSLDVQKESFDFDELPPEVQQRILALPEKEKPIEYATTIEHTIHSGIDLEGKQVKVSLPLDEESEGSKKYYGLIGRIDYILSRGSVLIIDEIDAQLHPLLVKRLIKLFLDPESNSKNAQIIFTTHSAEIMDMNLLRVDQIKFAEKSLQNQSTELYSLADFESANINSSNLRNKYLHGAYGAIPFISNSIL